MKKKILYFIILLSLAIFSVKVEAKTNYEKEFLYDEIGAYLSGFGYDDTDIVSLSQEYNVYNSDEHTRMVFVKVDNQNVGAISLSDNKKTVFLYGENLLKQVDNQSFNIVSNKENIEIHTKDKIYSWYSKKKYCVANNETNYSGYKKIKYKDATSEVEINNGDVDGNGTMGAEVVNGDYQTKFVYVSTNQKTLKKINDIKNAKNRYIIPVQLMKNDEVKIGKEKYGMCWAASGASIIQYKRGDIWSYSTWKNYNNLKKYYGGNPIGTVEWEKKMWEYHKLKMTYVSHRMSYNTVSKLMKNNKPVYCSFVHNEKNTNNNYAHAVVLCGSYHRTDLDKYYYVYMDPNWAGDGVYVINHILSSELKNDTGNYFYYNPGDGSIYNNWRYSFY